MIGSWMLYTVAVTALLLGAAFPAEYVVRALGRPTRFVWAAALLMSLVLPVARLVRGSAPPVQQTASASAPSTLPVISGGPIVLSRTIASVATQRVRASIESVDTSSLDRWNRALVAAWLAASALVLAYLAIAFAGVNRLQRRLATEVVDGHRVLLSHDLGPALFGVIRSRIVMPRWVLALAEQDRRIILAHETEHALAHDPALLLASLVVVALAPWNLALWVVVARLRYAIEADCDARVLRGSVNARSYGELLVRVHAQSVPVLGARLAFVGMTTKLEGRLKRIMRGKPRLSSVGGAASGLAVAMLILCAWVTPMPARTHANSPSRAVVTQPGQERAPTFVPIARATAALSMPDASPRGATASAPVVEPPAQVTAQPTTQAATEPGFCGQSIANPAPTEAQLQRWVAERHPRSASDSRTQKIVIGFLIDAATCSVTRDTVVPAPNAKSYEAHDILRLAFPDLKATPDLVGLSARDPNTIISYAMFYPAPDQTSNECGFGTSSGGTCSMDGGIVIRVVDSTRVLVALVAPGSESDTSRTSHLFLFTSNDPLPALLSRTINFGHIEYATNFVYIVSRSGSDPAVSFGIGIKTAPGSERARAMTYGNGIGISHILWKGLSLDAVQRMKPAASCFDGTGGGACYEVGGKPIRFPH